MSTNPVYETMTRWVARCSSGQITVRVWRESAAKRRGPDKEIIKALDKAEFIYGAKMDDISKLFIDAVCTLDRIAAVEVLDHEGNGEVFYPDWK